MGNDRREAAKKTLLSCMHDLDQLAEHGSVAGLVSKLKVQQQLLERLDERNERSQLPEGFVHLKESKKRFEKVLLGKFAVV